MPDQHLWACALQIERQYGDRAAQHIIERTRELAEKGDTDGVLTWAGIAERIEMLGQGVVN